MGREPREKVREMMKHIVVDLEMNPVNRAYRDVRRRLNEEVIEIGAVRLGDDFQQEATFQTYVRPEYGAIKKHIKELTGITEAKVTGQPVYADAFRAFLDWVGTSEDVKIYSWSLSDIKQLRNECRFKLPDFDTSWLDSRWVDLQQEFDSRLGLHHNLALEHALGAIDHKFEGTQHTALADAINTSAILALMQDEEKFKKTMEPVLEILHPKKTLTDSIGDLYPELMKLKEPGDA